MKLTPDENIERLLIASDENQFIFSLCKFADPTKKKMQIFFCSQNRELFMSCFNLLLIYVCYGQGILSVPGIAGFGCI